MTSDEASPSEGGEAAWNEPLAVDAVRPEESLVVSLDGYEGPLDLLLDLARTHKVDLANISMVALADQYLSYIAAARLLKIEVAADYLVMAAWLAYLKSRLLLPREEMKGEELSADELALRLRFRLKRLEAMREAAAQLLTRKRLGRDVFPRGMPEGVRTIRERQYTAAIFDLLKAYASERQRTIKHKHVVKRRVVWSIKEARTRLEKLVGSGSEQWVQLDFFLEQYLPTPELGKTVLASSFGATLEMAREGLVELSQAGPFAPLYVRRRGDTGAWERVA